MGTIRRRSLLSALSFLSVLLCVPIRAHGEDSNPKEARMFVITNWDENCDGSQRNSWDNMVQAWYNRITDDLPAPFGHGADAWIPSGSIVNGDILDDRFVDESSYVWGRDNVFVDSADALMVGLHGVDALDDHRWCGRVLMDLSGPGNCNANQGHIELGDNDLEFLLLSSCNSMDRDDWWPNWNSSFDGLHQVDGFHGLMWINSSYVGRYQGFASDAFWISIADAWLDNLYIHHANNSHDQCPVARNVGTDGSNSLSRMNHERFNHVYSDPPGLGSPRNHRVRYIKGCDPKGKGALPS